MTAHLQSAGSSFDHQIFALVRAAGSESVIHGDSTLIHHKDIEKVFNISFFIIDTLIRCVEMFAAAVKLFINFVFVIIEEKFAAVSVRTTGTVFGF